MSINILILTPLDAVAPQMWQHSLASAILIEFAISRQLQAKLYHTTTECAKAMSGWTTFAMEISPSLFEVDAVGASVGVLVSFEIIQGHPEFAKDGISKFF